MRAAAVIVLAVLASTACGGSAPPPPQTAASDTSSLETGSAASKEAPADTAEPASSSAAVAPAASSAPAAPASDTAAPAAFHAAPSATGAIDGKPFTPKVAQVLGPMKKDGRILLSLTETAECPAPGDAAKGEHAALTLVVPWLDGYKVDLAALKLSGKKGPGDIGFSRGKKDSATFKPSGTVTVVSAPTTKGATGKLKIDLQSGDYMLAGTMDVEVCVSPK